MTNFSSVRNVRTQVGLRAELGEHTVRLAGTLLGRRRLLCAHSHLFTLEVHLSYIRRK
ncbi:hypothetical protein BIW11_11850 [Tropilaelaps mercedesae]|uniref:Uncharacterized protein n=1 Tax=Tropilaelaps mercedesae TaxID=418985 RepID=A0A1V9X9S3_9ACAR|nr:hypothetical protein BIW11_11850 [Tropilaelaps mercedesae]